MSANELVTTSTALLIIDLVAQRLKIDVFSPQSTGLN